MGKESKRQLIWQEIRKQKEFTLDSLASGTCIERGTIRTYVVGLERAGFVEVFTTTANAKTQFRTNCYVLKKDVGIDAPRVTCEGKILPPDIKQDLWRTMKILKEFSISDLLAMSQRPTTFGNVQQYCIFLNHAKYLRRKGNRFVFVKSTGPKAPQILRIKAVFDPNLKQIVYQSGGDE